MEKQEHSSSDQDRLEALEEKVKAARSARQPKQNGKSSGWEIGLGYASSFSSAVIVGGLLGYGIDYFVKTTPWALLAGIILGFLAGTRNIIRLAGELSAETDQTQDL